MWSFLFRLRELEIEVHNLREDFEILLRDVNRVIGESECQI